MRIQQQRGVSYFLRIFSTLLANEPAPCNGTTLIFWYPAHFACPLLPCPLCNGRGAIILFFSVLVPCPLERVCFSSLRSTFVLFSFFMFSSSQLAKFITHSIGSFAPVAQLSNFQFCNMGKNNQSRRPNKRKRSAGSRQKAQAKATQKYCRKTLRKRGQEWRRRLGSSYGLSGSRGSIGPAIPLPRDVVHGKLCMDNYCSLDVGKFYAEHLEDNNYLELRQRNVSNPEGKEGGGRGVFARCDIPAGTKLAPYVGKCMCKPCPPSLGCGYCLRVDNEYYLCARDELYDLGYFSQLDGEVWNGWQSIHTHRPCPPNYSRYFNSLTFEQQLDDNYDFNCVFEIDPFGHDVIFIETNKEVKKGEELLVDYGPHFVVV